MKGIRVIVMILVIIGALNLGIVGFFDYNVLAEIFGGMGSTGTRTVYGIIGIAGLIAGIRFICKCCHCCKPCGPCGSDKVCKCCGKENCQCRK